jgi:hypothetical protein
MNTLSIAALVAGIALGLPFALASSLFLGLWVRSYDLPLIRAIAILVLSILLAAVGAWAGFQALIWLSRLGDYPVASAVLVAAWLSPFVALLLACAYDADVTITYLSVQALPAVLAAPSIVGLAVEPRPYAAALLALGALAFWTWNRMPARRLKRYSAGLQECWCCGFRERAIRQLLTLGPRGQAVIDRRLAEVPEWEQRQMQAYM